MTEGVALYFDPFTKLNIPKVLKNYLVQLMRGKISFSPRTEDTEILHP
ncbi:hypothetical protein SAMN05216352_11955 [Alteribacillus bidgolensis]|uniref:Uncharacterized protein n=1 Tax=Alteribacillus bidgolensis TaxID=930129 RepID=A0A1G8QFL0_9BACI|nr:hypothetical protein SAMN05216352_11955 [Alteribacillus bidgolensis]